MAVDCAARVFAARGYLRIVLEEAWGCRWMNPKTGM
jgi:hypothetical protein